MALRRRLSTCGSRALAYPAPTFFVAFVIGAASTHHQKDHAAAPQGHCADVVYFDEGVLQASIDDASASVARAVAFVDTPFSTAFATSVLVVPVVPVILNVAAIPTVFGDVPKFVRARLTPPRFGTVVGAARARRLGRVVAGATVGGATVVGSGAGGIVSGFVTGVLVTDGDVDGIEKPPGAAFTVVGEGASVVGASAATGVSATAPGGASGAAPTIGLGVGIVGAGAGVEVEAGGVSTMAWTVG